jgi:hypothetical protein
MVNIFTLFAEKTLLGTGTIADQQCCSCGNADHIGVDDFEIEDLNIQGVLLAVTHQTPKTYRDAVLHSGTVYFLRKQIKRI